MRSLEEAWTWFRAARASLTSLPRLSEQWDDLPWGTPGFSLDRDGTLKKLTARQLKDQAEEASRPLNDLAVLVLFSVFEGIVRKIVVDQIKPEQVGLRHPALRLAAEQAIELIEEGSFARVLEPYKAAGHADLVEEVNQVRKFRNWVAHGRRGAPDNRVDPWTAYDRLSRFLAVIRPAVPPASS